MKTKTDQPTCKIRSNGDKAWWLNGKLHRTDGPAIEDVDGYKSWWINGELHRLDGPAREYSDGTIEWYLNGKCFVNKQDYIKVALKQKLITKEDAFILAL
jgi:hypothetical protein